VDGPAVSPDGLRLAYEDGRSVCVANIDGSNGRCLTDNGADPTWSPDGAKIAFSRDGDIWSTNADGSRQVNLTNSPGEERDPTWSPDGAHIAYTRAGCASGGGSCIYKMDADGTDQINLTQETDIPCPTGNSYHFRSSDHAAWSPPDPNGDTKIAFRGPVGCVGTSAASGANIWVMNPDGGGKTRLIDDNATFDDQPAWSPDGTKIAFASDRDTENGTREIYVMPSAGGTITPLTTNTTDERNPDWQPLPECTKGVNANNDPLIGTPARDVLCGDARSNTINGAAGNDIVLGKGGDDEMIGAPGNDTLNGGAGLDTILYPGQAPVRASLTTSFATGVGSDILLGVENLTGSSADDRLTGSSGANALVGGKGADALFGLGGNDSLDSKDGVNGNDSLDGGAGTDSKVTDNREAKIVGFP